MHPQILEPLPQASLSLETTLPNTTPPVVMANVMPIADGIHLVEAENFRPNEWASSCAGLLHGSLALGIFVLQLSAPFEVISAELSQGNPYLIAGESINLILFISAILFACASIRTDDDVYALDANSLSTRFIKNIHEFYGIGMSRTQNWTLFMLFAVGLSDVAIFQCASANLSLSLENKKYNSDLIAAEFTPITACILTFLFAHLSNHAMRAYHTCGASFFSSRVASETSTIAVRSDLLPLLESLVTEEDRQRSFSDNPYS